MVKVEKEEKSTLNHNIQVVNASAQEAIGGENCQRGKQHTEYRPD
jgi:hypothetical protein